MRSFAVVIVAALACLVAAVPATATPVATSAEQYQAYGAVFPDPLAVCQGSCDPRSRGRVAATQFIQWSEFNDALVFMNQQEDWRRYMEVLPLDGKMGDGSGTQAGDEMWPGNNLSKLEWRPRPKFHSAGLATSTQEQGTGKTISDLIVVRVTDENVPDANKKRYALSLSIHGIERAGAEGGIRAMEEIVTAVAEGRGDESILPEEVRKGAASWREVLANTIIYFTFPNPDGWRRGSISEAGVFFQRYNGNGVDLNRDWPDIGFQYRGYSGGSEPETRAFQSFYSDVIERGGPFAAGDDLHGQPFADALSYTLLPHGRHDLEKDYRIRQAAKLINRAQYEATKWSPLIIENDQEAEVCEDTGAIGTGCTAIYAQTWGSVYDTINYTTTGTLGDWFDSRLGLNADGIDNEMSFSHVDRNIAFDPQGEQLHVAGNKAIIYSHVDDLLRPPRASYTTPGSNAFVPNTRLTRKRQEIQAGPPPGTSPQADILDQPPTGAGPEGSIFEFDVGRDAKTYSGGMRIDVRPTDVQGIGSGNATLRVQCMGCDNHVGQEEDEWVTVAEDYNQSFLYAQAGITAAVNRPQPGRWRAVVSAPGGVPRFSVSFSSEPATSDGATGGDDPPLLAAYDVANTDFLGDLNRDANEPNDEFSAVDPAQVIAGTQSLSGADTLVLADNPLPGYVGLYEEEVRPSGPPTADFDFEHSTPTTPGQGNESCLEVPSSREEFPFETAPNAGNAELVIEISWLLETSDYDLYLFRDVNGNGSYDAGTDTEVTSSAGFINISEEITVPRPPAGKYVIVVANCSAPSEADPWSGSATFEGFPALEGEQRFTAAQKDTWMARLRNWVEAGGNLVLTDSSVRALPELTNLPGSAIEQQTVYLGQTSFLMCAAFAEDDTCSETKETLDDPLARDVAQLGARFNSGMRRQTYEPTPLGFAIQGRNGADGSFSPQWDIDQRALQAAGGRVVGGSTTGSPSAAVAVPERTTIGEFKIGSGTIRVIGALLPQPSTRYDHQLGIEPYALTYTGHILFCNLIDCRLEQRPRRDLPNAPAPPGPVEPGFGARLKTPLLVSKKSRRGKRVKLRVKAKGRKQIRRFVVQYRKTGAGTKRTYKKFKPRLKRSKRRIFFKKGRIGRTYLFRIRAVGKTGVRTNWRYRRIVVPYDERGKRRRYSPGWTRVKSRRAWLGGYTQSSARGAKMRFRTGRGGRFYVIGRTSPNGGVALVRRGFRRKVVSFRSKRVRNRRVVAVFNGSPKKKYRLIVRVRRGPVAIDGIGVRRR